MSKKESTKTEYQRIKEDLEDLEMYIREFSSFLPLAVCTVNPPKIIIDANQSFQNLTNYNPMEIIGEPLEKVFLEKKEIDNLLEEIQEKRRIVDKELTIISKDKKEIPVNVSISARKDEEGNYIGCFMAFSDITEIKKNREGLEAKIKERTKALQDKIEELGRFNRLAVGREVKMIELKEEIGKLKEELEKNKYEKK